MVSHTSRPRPPSPTCSRAWQLPWCSPEPEGIHGFGSSQLCSTPGPLLKLPLVLDTLLCPTACFSPAHHGVCCLTCSQPSRPVLGSPPILPLHAKGTALSMGQVGVVCPSWRGLSDHAVDKPVLDMVPSVDRALLSMEMQADAGRELLSVTWGLLSGHRPVFSGCFSPTVSSSYLCTLVNKQITNGGKRWNLWDETKQKNKCSVSDNLRCPGVLGEHFFWYQGSNPLHPWPNTLFFALLLITLLSLQWPFEE